MHKGFTQITVFATPTPLRSVLSPSSDRIEADDGCARVEFHGATTLHRLNGRGHPIRIYASIVCVQSMDGVALSGLSLYELQAGGTHGQNRQGLHT